jgi:hypothetical protein
LQFEAATGWIPQLNREPARLSVLRIGKSRRHIRARDRKDCEVYPARRDRSDMLDRCASFGENPAFDPDNFVAGGFDTLNVNPGSCLHFVQAGQWKRIVQLQGGVRGAGLAARSSKAAGSRFLEFLRKSEMCPETRRRLGLFDSGR